VAGTAVGFVFLLITVIDIEHRLIPHVVVVPSALVLGLMQAVDPSRGPVKTALGGVAGAASFYVLYLLGEAFARALARARGRSLDEVAFGFGDVTLAGLIGLIVGWPAVVLALLVGILAAGLFSLAYVLVMLARRRYTAFTPILRPLPYPGRARWSTTAGGACSSRFCCAEPRQCYRLVPVVSRGGDRLLPEPAVLPEQGPRRSYNRTSVAYGPSGLE
jgi:Flp pilus assembly protein protease CpaA